MGSYDANGNLYLGNWSYDVENRLVGVDAAGGERYMYDPSNKRIYKQNNCNVRRGDLLLLRGRRQGDGRVYVRCAGRQRVRTVGLTMMLVTESAYFGGKKVLPSVARDRLGSVRANGSPANHPYGENYSGSNADGFATYYQDCFDRVELCGPTIL